MPSFPIKFGVWSNYLLTIVIIKSSSLKSVNCSQESDCESSNDGGHTPAGGRMKLAMKIQNCFVFFVSCVCTHVESHVGKRAGEAPQKTRPF